MEEQLAPSYSIVSYNWSINNGRTSTKLQEIRGKPCNNIVQNSFNILWIKMFFGNQSLTELFQQVQLQYKIFNTKWLVVDVYY